MNKQGDNGIEWTHVFGPRTGYTWPVFGGCFHRCRWQMPNGVIAKCYAENVANGVARGAYPEGFEHHYWRPDNLEEPLRIKTPAGIFIDSMADAFGSWVPEEQIRAVLDVIRRADWHVFMSLTKNAPRLLKFKDDLPPNLWVGVSMPPTYMFGKQLRDSQQRSMFGRALDVLAQLIVPVRWISFEPLSFDVGSTLAHHDVPLEWAVIGAASDGPTYFQPDVWHVNNLIETLKSRDIPVFFKGNLRFTPRLEEFPTLSPGVPTRVASEPQQLSMF